MENNKDGWESGLPKHSKWKEKELMNQKESNTQNNKMDYTSHTIRNLNSLALFYKSFRHISPPLTKTFSIR